MKATQPRVSFADLERWPEDGRRYELYDGAVYVVPSPLPQHQIASARLHFALQEYASEYGGSVLYAPLDIVLTEYDAFSRISCSSRGIARTWSTRNR